ncbi:toll/interleukin-1 receptor domain-containing protein [Bacillus wiedmannii]|uniref:toll/interleukin-1 receptor domain-containing protein n=1 Tax=Bacillus wiedmannii TaxID=1890302 RepID=UPI002E1E8645|nr:toll/interleukin-1 receptor domain-containing protein [Bacillus wiedmannii]
MRYFVIGGLVGSDFKCETEKKRFENTCVTIGQTLCDLGHSLIVCSPFKDSADYWVLQGFKRNNPKENQVVEFHFIDSDPVRAEIEKLEAKLHPLRIIKIPSPPPNIEDSKSNSYSWLLCQLQALESCQIIIAIGGKLGGSANMLLLLAESKRKQIIPLSFLAGAARESFLRRRYELADKFGDNYVFFQDETKIAESIKLGEVSISYNSTTEKSLNSPNFFISYPRARPGEADYIETLIRRRNFQVFRDESDFGAGYAIPKQIEEAIYAADIFIAVWCAEYACSPWCFDELELALDRCETGKLKLWIICTDETRIVPVRARNLINYTVSTRDDIEGRILKLLEREIGT